jgi:poly(hydroxyalkanoate) depolymerase family esterase
MPLTRSLAAALRRASRLTPARMARATRSIQAAMTELMLTTALTPLKTAKAKAKRAKSKSPAVKLPKPRRPRAGQSLSSVLGHMRAARRLMQASFGGTVGRAPAAPALPQGARFLTRRHRSPAGSRGYKLYVPASHPDRPRGLIVMLHGCNQTPDDFALGTRMNALGETHGLVIAYPGQTRASNPAACWNWFRPGDQHSGGGEPAILAALARKLAREFALGHDRVFVAGLSAGGAMAMILADVYPDVFAAAGVHSGLARGAAHDLRSALSAMRSGRTDTGIAVTPRAARARLILFQGDADDTVHPSNATRIMAVALGPDAVPARTVRRSVAGRAYTRLEYPGPDGLTCAEHWTVHGAGHAWSGGRGAGSYTDPKGPDASAQMVRFFLQAKG